MKYEIRINNGQAVVSKAFMKEAGIWNSQAYRMLKEFRAENPEMDIVTKEIKKNPEKKTYKNLTYDNMKLYISTLEKKNEFLTLFEMTQTRSKVQKNPYQYMVTWFTETFDYTAFVKLVEENSTPEETNNITPIDEKKTA